MHSVWAHRRAVQQKVGGKLVGSDFSHDFDVISFEKSPPSFLCRKAGYGVHNEHNTGSG